MITVCALVDIWMSLRGKMHSSYHETKSLRTPQDYIMENRRVKVTSNEFEYIFHSFIPLKTTLTRLSISHCDIKWLWKAYHRTNVIELLFTCRVAFLTSNDFEWLEILQSTRVELFGTNSWFGRAVILNSFTTSWELWLLWVTWVTEIYFERQTSQIFLVSDSEDNEAFLLVEWRLTPYKLRNKGLNRASCFEVILNPVQL